MKRFFGKGQSPLGREIIITIAVDELLHADEKFDCEIAEIVMRFHAADWGDTHPSDKIANDNALTGGDRILAKYKTSRGDIFIITEQDKTTILFAHEY
jgi:hypothetical protein